ncbi:hypothetical protein HO173_005653 [Letharia columbiana]|uniref:Rhodopsin domain-containing protein n=1 Tax=Letharia columbiana TaxID=112416 RepID=A0A8H6FWB5_9LECA|nr:uncharacterized protein HO173_005653 [Letharia columbiana]KAF6236025.1 hypothetical protein HO173_005653 [Letharia columbiana]
MYNEANHILWVTNTSFKDGITFKRLVGPRSLIQKRTLKKLRIQMDEAMDEHKFGTSSFNMAIIQSLQGLRHLRLHTDYGLALEDYDLLKNRFTSLYCTSYVESLEKIANLPLTSVEVVVKNPACTERKNRYENQWLKGERREAMANLAEIDPSMTPTFNPPPGQQPNFTDSPSSQNWLVATGILCLAFAIVFICARTFVKTYIIKKTQIEDSQQHSRDPLRPRNVPSQTLRPDADAANLPRHKERCRLLGHLILVWSNFVFYVTVTFCFIFACVPRAQLSNPMLSGTCVTTMDPYILATSAINIASDFSILFLPVFAVWKLQIALKRKMTISAVFGTGLFACISSIIRLVYSVHLTLATDRTRAMEPVFMWAFAEFTTVILAGAIPTTPRLIQWLRGHKDSPPYVQAYQKPSKPSYVTISNGLADVEAEYPGRGMNIVKATRKSYIPLEKDVGRMSWEYEAEAEQDIFGKGPSAQQKSGWEAREEMGDGLLRPVKMQTCYIP